MISATASNPTNKLRPTSFLLSACIHVSVLAVLAFGPQPSSSPARPIYESKVQILIEKENANVARQSRERAIKDHGRI